MSLIFAEDGHLLDLAVEGLLHDELDPAELLEVEAHLDDCAACRERIEAARAFTATPLPPMALPTAQPQAVATGTSTDPNPQAAANNLRHFVWAVPTFIAAAAAALIFLPTGPEPSLEPDGPLTLRPKGPGFSLEVFRETADSPEQLLDGHQVQPGDHIGYRIRLEEPAHVLLLGADSTGAVYPIWPADGRSQEQPASEDPTTLSRAIELDATPGVERMVGVACPSPVPVEQFDLTTVPEQGEIPLLLEGCEQEVVRLIKGGS